MSETKASGEGGIGPGWDGYLVGEECKGWGGEVTREMIANIVDTA
jgi:hypothetical protein